MWLYHIGKNDDDKGTNMVLSAVREENTIPVKVAPLIFISTIITHLFGGSAGREGAALQMGGSIGNGVARLFRINDKGSNIVIMCGMSAAFSALFGTPMAAAFFAMEVVSVGIMHYAALVPCVISSLIAVGIAKYFGVHAESFTILNIPTFSLTTALKIGILAILCAVISVLFCILLHQTARIFKTKIKDPYIRIAVAGCLIIALTYFFKTTDYLGAGMNIVERAIEGDVKPSAFLLKMIFTAITLGAGYKGGEIVPTMFVGATFGCLMGSVLGISPSLCAAVGLIALFCGVTNCPITSLLISIELFGLAALP